MYASPTGFATLYLRDDSLPSTLAEFVQKFSDEESCAVLLRRWKTRSDASPAPGVGTTKRGPCHHDGSMSVSAANRKGMERSPSEGYAAAELWGGCPRTTSLECRAAFTGSEHAHETSGLGVCRGNGLPMGLSVRTQVRHTVAQWERNEHGGQDFRVQDQVNHWT